MLIRTDRIGDVILTLPMIDVLKQNYPRAKIDFLVNKRVYDLVCDYPNINKVHAIEKVTINNMRRLCGGNKYDLAIVVRPLFAIAFGLFLGGVKHRLGSAYRWYSLFFNIKHYQHRKYSVKHELEYNLDLLFELNCKMIKGIRPELKVGIDELDRVKNKLMERRINLSKDFIVIHIPSMDSAKVWSRNNFTELINLILNDPKCDFNIILTGTKDDAQQVKSVIDKLENNMRVYEILDLNLKELAALLKIAKLFAGNSTGPIHIAAAVSTFVVGFYSPVKVESQTRWGPYTHNRKIFSPPADDDSRDVMDDIEPGEVFSFIKNYMLTN
ncbi:MAG: glycosyltransferase family 9 protein [Chlorobi bacterium]|nr:glycosyltransferase family 9 protein [Chlorobiota bacterium]MCI0716214.1 glycosyltransferase family 9 protein [Chlorobiota bacterium]